jgi:hypothetical protein
MKGTLALRETCYYPVDLLQKPGLIPRWGPAGQRELARFSAEP